jgi:hypothetical protein
LSPAIRDLPKPWLTDPEWTNLAGLADDLATRSAGDFRVRVFVDILREADAKLSVEPLAGVDRKNFAAQTVLSCATGKVTPAAERWAVQWLETLRLPYLRQWWRYSVADRRKLGTRYLSTSVSALSGDDETLLIGHSDGCLRTARLDGARPAEVTELARLDRTVWAIARNGTTIVAGGAGGHLAVVRNDVPSIIALARSGMRATATDGERVAVGFEDGHVWLEGVELGWAGTPHYGRVLAMAFHGAALRCLFEDGLIAETQNGTLVARGRAQLTGLLRVAAWRQDGEQVAAGTTTGDVLLLDADGQIRHRLLQHTVISAVAWSRRGMVATAGPGRRVWIGTQPWGDRDRYSLRPVGPVSELTFVGDLLVSGDDRELTVWEVSGRGLGGADTDPPSAVVKLALDPDRPDVVASAASSRRMPGRLRQHGAEGRIDSAEGKATGMVEALVAGLGGWLVGGIAGLHHWTPGAQPLRIHEGTCLAVAVSGDRWYAGSGNVVISGTDTSPGSPFYAHGDNVIDIVVSEDGVVVSLDQAGELRIDGAVVPGGPQICRLVLGGAGADVLILDWGGALHRYDDGSFTALWSAGGRVEHVAALANGRLVLARVEADTVEVVDVATGHCLATLSLHATALAASGNRLAVAEGEELTLYDLVDPATRPHADDLIIKIQELPPTGGAEVIQYRVTFPGGSVAAMPTAIVRDVVRQAEGSAPSDATVEDEGHLPALLAADRVGGWMRAAGLRRVVDQAIGEQLALPALVRFVVPVGDMRVFPWELTVDMRQLRVVRSVDRATARNLPGASSGRVRLAALRAAGAEFEVFARLYPSILDRFPRFLPIDADNVATVQSCEDIEAALRPAADVILLLAHSNKNAVAVGGAQAGAMLNNVIMADLLAAASPRLVVLAACRSLELAHLLVERGVEAVVALRTNAKIYALDQLLEELVVSVMVGMPVDEAYTHALDACVRLPRAGIPVLYLHPQSAGKLVLAPSWR